MALPLEGSMRLKTNRSGLPERISKPPDIHTTQAVTAGERVGLIDFFAPVRWDFSNIDGMVVNRSEYPMLADKPPSYAGVTTVYAPDDPRAALNRTPQRA